MEGFKNGKHLRHFTLGASHRSNQVEKCLSALVRTIILGFSHQQRQIFLSILWSGRKTVFLAGCLTSGRIKRGGGQNGWEQRIFI